MSKSQTIRNRVLDAMPNPRQDRGIHEIKDHVRAEVPDASITDIMREVLTLSGQGRIRAHGQGESRRYSRRV